MSRNHKITNADLEDALQRHLEEQVERMALYEESSEPMVRYYRWSIFGAKEMPLVDGTAAKTCHYINYCLWTYDYDWDNMEYMVDGFVDLKEPMTKSALIKTKWFESLPENVCLSEATASDYEYYDAIHTSVKLGWQPTASYPVDTVTPSNTPELPEDPCDEEDCAIAKDTAGESDFVERMARANAADLEMWCEDDVTRF